MGKKIRCDRDLCVGCGACVVACMDEKDVDLAAGEVGNRWLEKMEQWENGVLSITYRNIACHHCKSYPCLPVCPTGAITRDEETGAVLVNQELCIGCRKCDEACHHHIPKFNSQGKMTKCDLCYLRLQAGREPACVKVCPLGALTLEEASDHHKKPKDHHHKER